MQGENARALLHQVPGPGAEFRGGQWEAVDIAANLYVTMQQKPQMNTDGHRFCGLIMRSLRPPGSHRLGIGFLDRKETTPPFSTGVYLCPSVVKAFFNRMVAA